MTGWYALVGALLLPPLAARAQTPPWPIGVPSDAVFTDVRRVVAALGVYRATVVKTERVRGKVVGPETAQVWIQERPRAIRMTFLVNGKATRRVLYDERLRPRQMLVRERGLLGFIAVWVTIDGWLVRRNTNHTIRDVGFGALLDLIDRDLERARPVGGHRRTDEAPGAGPGGTTCMTFTAPAAARDLYARRTRLCFDGSRLPVFVEVFDAQGFLEKYEWHDVAPRQNVGPAFFTADGGS